MAQQGSSKSRCALVVEDDEGLAETLASLLGEYFDEVVAAHTVRAAVELLAHHTPSLALLDFSLPDGNAFDVLEHLAKVRPAPIVVSVSGEADTKEGFRLARLGVRAFLPKPCSLAEVRQTLTEAMALLPDPIPDIRASVGLVPFNDVESEVRRALAVEALERSGGSVKAAAQLLGISRQRLQYIVRTMELSDSVGAGSGPEQSISTSR